jgi:hypothetical protein
MIVPVVLLGLADDVGAIKYLFSRATTLVLYVNADGDQLKKWSRRTKGPIQHDPQHCEAGSAQQFSDFRIYD